MPPSTARPALCVLGAGGHGKVVLSAAATGGARVAAVYDDDPHTHGDHVLGVPIVGPIADAEHATGEAVIAIGDNPARIAIAKAFALRWATVIHPAAYVDSHSRVGPGAQILAGAVVQPCADVGAHAIVNSNAIVEHDSTVGVAAHVSCGACLAGGAVLGDGSLLGVNSCVLPGVRVGDRTVVGAGAVVVKDLPGGVVAVGVPARVIDAIDR